MNKDKAKREAAAAGLDLYWSSEWRSWGLVDPEGRVDGEWFSSGSLKEMSAHEFNISIGVMHEKIHPGVAGEIPIEGNE